MWDITKDYMNSFIGIAILLVPLIREWIKSANRSKSYISFLVICCIGLLALGIDKINRDNKKDSINEKRRSSDSTKLDAISNSYAKDTARFSDFKKKLEMDFHIKDSANAPVQIHYYKPVYNTHINKADKVSIGGDDH